MAEWNYLKQANLYSASSFFIGYWFYLVFKQHPALYKVYLLLNAYLLTTAGHFMENIIDATVSFKV